MVVLQHATETLTLQHATETLTALDLACDELSIIARLNQFIAESLMISLCMVMLDVFANGALQRPPSKEDHSVEELRFQTAKPSFHILFSLGLFGGSRMTSVSVFCSIKPRIGMKLLSRSMIR